ncbi:similar to Saccharomyces cerevisiae YOL147C PEX11 Peroxisomal membrane protein required for medium-chain fatty acid oxidation and peroxisome proliferation [Maudiozyma saulgeensis]|uniref:Similar to Saccharomyces cerevisiae YOL147C PEX11 Peroxisomal membrane protein required for medium-chain fatty acid oxidation and peroxisome proliferation n=1 Tax=Maudiozyma saulgeensis TaxID=1789683 RepID=A0A1X7RA06_9SACH|nr:similar to Saccharomyces cerevisiae YOL147C PEX11 Peroxisomal membrane protein required for medium-chain fatty acid oxidation and peroxisome proliferation [Kazachstania saulgeensis]
MNASIDKFIKFTNITDVREKLLRWTQFLIVLLIAWFPRIKVLPQLKLQILIIRKVLRCFKPLHHANVAQKNYKTNSNALLILKNIFFMLYLGLDQIVLLRMVNMLPTNPLTLQLAPKFANLFWLTALSIDIRINLNNMKVMDDDLIQNKSKENRNLQRIQTSQKQYNALRKIVWDIMDSYIVSTYLNYMKPYNTLVGIFGMTTSMLALQDIWQKC